MTTADQGDATGGDAGGFDPDSLPRAAPPDPTLPGTLDLGVLSISLAVADLDASLAFYGALGFERVGGDPGEGWLILKNGESTIGLFQGMFDRNVVTFNPGLTPRMERVQEFTDVRDIQRRLEDAGLELTTRVEEGTTGAGSITLVDPDGNPVLIDQFF